MLRRVWRAASERGRAIGRTVLKGLISGLRGATRIGLKLGAVAVGITGIGSLGLVAYGGWRLAKAHGRSERVDALRDISFGTAGVGRLGLLAGQLSRPLGLLGSGLQSAVGGYSLVRGLRDHDRDAAVSGALDLGAGALFSLSVMSIANPYTLIGAGVLTAGRMLYNKRKGIGSALEKLRDRLFRGDRAPDAETSKPDPERDGAVRRRPARNQRSRAHNSVKILPLGG